MRCSSGWITMLPPAGISPTTFVSGGADRILAPPSGTDRLPMVRIPTRLFLPPAARRSSHIAPPTMASSFRAAPAANGQFLTNPTPGHRRGDQPSIPVYSSISAMISAGGPTISSLATTARTRRAVSAAHRRDAGDEPQEQSSQTAPTRPGRRATASASATSRRT